MDELFFELMQVATGKLDCLSRGPEPEEWQQLYELSKQQQVAGLCYQGVERLFEFGLRAPQDVSIDWMADAEEEGAYGEGQRGRMRIQDVYRLYLQRRLNMRVLVDYADTLRRNNGKNETLKGGGPLSLIGQRRFGRGVMWMLQHTLLLESEHMPFTPLESEGRFLLSDVMQKASRWQRLRHVLLTYPLGIADLRA